MCLEYCEKLSINRLSREGDAQVPWLPPKRKQDETLKTLAVFVGGPQEVAGQDAGQVVRHSDPTTYQRRYLMTLKRRITRSRSQGLQHTVNSDYHQG